MELYLGKLAARTKLQDVRRLLAPTQIKVAVRLVYLRGRNDVFRFALIQVSADRDARKLIKLLQGQVLKGQKVSIHEYVYRACMNERRSLDWRQRQWGMPERRLAERRCSRQRLEPPSINPSYTAYGPNSLR